MIMDFTTAITYFSGGMIISSLFFIIHLICTINPYHKAIFPMLTSVTGLMIGIFLIANISGSYSMLSIREVISNSVIIIISVSPIILALFTYIFFKISFYKKDPNHLEITK